MKSGDSQFPDSGPTGSAKNPEKTEIFSLLGDETRLRILLALHEPSTETPVEFAELFDQIDAEFTSGFNYHLDKLTPEFVTKAGAGYELTTFGRRVALTITAGAFDGYREIDRFPIDGACVVCGERALHACYKGEMFNVDCGSCGEKIIKIRPPPNLVHNCSHEELVDAIDQWMFNWMQMSIRLARNSICDYCGGAVESSVMEADHSDRLDILLRFDCADCGENRRCSVGTLAYQHPTVKRFHHQRGTYLRDRLYWEIEPWITDDHTVIVSSDPWRFEVTFYADGDSCTATVSGEPEVVDVVID